MDEIPPLEPYLAQTGRPIGTHFGYVETGFYNKNNIGSSKIPKNAFNQNPKPGDLIYKDLNGDGIINLKDQRAIGYPNIPQVNFGGQIVLKYKGFGLSMNWQGVTQVSRYITSSFRRPDLREGEGTLKYNLNHAWTPARAKNGTKNLIPRLSVGSAGQANYDNSTLWLRNGSYVRLKEAELSYTFSNKMLQHIVLRNLLVYLNGYNLLTFKHAGFKTMDPEKGLGHDTNHYPIMKIFNFGFNIKF
jgi:hypothetical protein